MKQPLSGVLATSLVIVVVFAMMSLFDVGTFTTWTAWLFMSMIPALILVGVTWRANPDFAAHLTQPAKGIALCFVVVTLGAIVAATDFFLVGGGVRPPPPMLVIYTITTVIVMFWLAVMFGGWPFVTAVKSPLVGGLLLLVACYGISYLLFHAFFDFGFMRGAPVYVAALDPRGLFNANLALVFIVTAIAVLFLLLHFDLWPLTAVPALRTQPWLGLAWTALAIAVGGLAMHVGVNVLKMDPLAFMVRVPIPFIFGTIVVLNMLQNSLFPRFDQPFKGVCNALVAGVLGMCLAALYGVLAPHVVGTLASGAPANDYERWLASALLGVTFPLLAIFADLFSLWPLVRKAKT